MYVLQPNATMISVLALNAPGQATSLQSVDISGPASQVGLAIGMHLDTIPSLSECTDEMKSS